MRNFKTRFRYVLYSIAFVVVVFLILINFINLKINRNVTSAAGASATITNQAEWQAGTLSSIDSTSTPGSIKLTSSPNTSSSWQSLTANPAFANNSAEATDGTDLFAFGGEQYPTILATTYKYDVSAASWSQLADIPQTTSRAAAEYANGYFYVLSGYRYSETTTKVYRYDPGANSWAEMASMPESRENPNAELRADGKMYVWGGA